MKSVYMEQRGSTGSTEHSKWYRIIDDGHRVIFKWGSTGSAGEEDVGVVSDDPAVREKVFLKKFKEKAKRKTSPYTVIEIDGNRVEERPSSEGRKWGLEVETHSQLDPAEIGRRMQQRGLKIRLATDQYFHSVGDVWDIKRDGSCGYEFASPILSGESGLFDAKLAVEKIREVCEAPVNEKCGLHVTVCVADHSDSDLQRLVVAYLKAQEHFYSFCNDSRQNNRYCIRNPVGGLIEAVKARDASSAIDVAGGWRNHTDRYHGMNFTRVFSRKVIEFRMMQSTVEIRRVGAWIRVCVGFVDGVKSMTKKFVTPKVFTRETFEALVGGTSELQA